MTMVVITGGVNRRPELTTLATHVCGAIVDRKDDKGKKKYGAWNVRSLFQMVIGRSLVSRMRN